MPGVLLVWDCETRRVVDSSHVTVYVFNVVENEIARMSLVRVGRRHRTVLLVIRTFLDVMVDELVVS